MFWKLFRNLPFAKHVSIPNNRFCTAVNSLGTEQQEYNQVKILGTIVSNARILSNGIKSVIVRTVEDGDIYSNHLVNIRTDEPLPTGERIYVFGSLSSKPFSLDDGRLGQKLTIKSKYIRLRGHERNVHTKDENNIKILAKISSDIRNTDKYSLFTLASIHSPKGDGRILGTIITEFHRVLVYDQSVINVVRNSLSKFDHVQIDGKVRYKPFKNSDGKTVHSGFIIAQSISRICI